MKANEKSLAKTGKQDNQQEKSIGIVLKAV